MIWYAHVSHEIKREKKKREGVETCANADFYRLICLNRRAGRTRAVLLYRREGAISLKVGYMVSL